MQSLPRCARMRFALTTALAGLLAAMLAPAAFAGQATVYAGTTGFGTFGAGPWVTAQGAGLNYGTLASGPFGIHLPNGSPDGYRSETRLYPPANTSFASATASLQFDGVGSPNYSENHWGSTWEGQTSISARTGAWNVFGYPYAYTTTQTANSPGYLSMHMGCASNPGYNCPGGDAVYWINSASYVLNDTATPNAALKDGGGALLDGSWHTANSAALALTASDDGLGVYRVVVHDGAATYYTRVDPSSTTCLDARPGVSSDYEFTARATSVVPCKLASEDYSVPVDLAQMGDGTHTGVDIAVEDAAGNEKVIATNRTLKINVPGNTLPDGGSIGAGGCTIGDDGTCLITNTTPVKPPSTLKRGIIASVTPGVWTAPGATYSYQWQRCTSTSAATCTSIVGATGASYTPVMADVDEYLRVIETATSSGYSQSVASSVSTKVVDTSSESTPNTGNPGTSPSSGGGSAPSGGGVGGGGTTKDVDAQAGSSTAGSAPASAAPTAKQRGSSNGQPASDDAQMKAVFASTKTNILSTSYGKGATVSGRLTTKSGVPIASAMLTVAAKVAGGRVESLGGRTDADGRFTIALPRNVLSQTVRVAYMSHQNDEAAADSEALTLRVKATAALGIRVGGTNAKSARKGRLTARNGSTLKFRAKVDGPIPVGGKTVQLQSRCTAKGCADGWANFGPSGQRTDSKGRFTWKVKTDGTVGTVTYRFRLVVPEVDGASNDWPLATGYSTTRTLTIRGSR